MYAAMSTLVLNTFDLTMTRYVVAEGEQPQTKKIEMPIMKMLIFSALICSSDTVAAVSIVDYGAQPKLFSCILGEGVFNDIVAITLYVAMLSLQGKEFSGQTLWLLTM
jgi:NhaP-type Na+/H+ or K+/H+ antiporter